MAQLGHSMADPCDEFQRAIMATLSWAPDRIEQGRVCHFSTNGRRSDRAGWYRLFEDMSGGVFGCHRSGIVQTWRAAEHLTMTVEERAQQARRVRAAVTERQKDQRKQWVRNARCIDEVWRCTVSLKSGDPVSRYLARRGFDHWPLPAVLRLHPALPYWQESKKVGVYPAMVAPIVAPNGRIVALHRTYLTDDGCKANVPSPKKVTGAAGRLAGASIPLQKPMRGCIGIAEGIETALAAWCGSEVPTVAAYCSGNLAQWHWPTGVQRLVIFADADSAGREAAETLRARASKARLSVDMLIPSDPGADWCDVWAARHAVMIESRDIA